MSKNISKTSNPPSTLFRYDVDTQFDDLYTSMSKRKMKERKFQNFYFWFTITEYNLFMIKKRGISNVYDELVIRVQSVLEKIL